MARKGLLLVNLGTPDAPETPEVRRYLREFLSDPRVLDMPAAGRWALLNFVILPFRPQKSAEAYRKVWMPEGSPLLVYSRALAEKVSAALGDGWVVELAMRYGEPSIARGLERLKAAGVSELTVLPLYPLNAASTNATTAARVFELLAEAFDFPPVRVLPPFYDHPGFLDAFTQVTRPVLDEVRADHVLYSFHGLPERHMLKGDPSGAHCLQREDCCATLGEVNRTCYRAQSFWTADALAQRLGLAREQYSVSFQSRLTKKWIQPYTDVVLPELAARGVKRLAVVCPAFVADCLETLEEVALRARDQFREAGGEELALVPSLNAHPAWVETVVALVEG